MNCSKKILSLAHVSRRELLRRAPLASVARRGTLAVFLLAACLPARALDFQLHTTKVEEDGFTREQDCFQYDAANNVYLTLPGRWNHADAPASLTLTAPDTENTLIRLEKSTSPAADTDFKDKSALESYRRRALGTVPPGATGVRMTEEHDLPVNFYHWRNYEFVLDYDFFGLSYRRSIVFLDLNAREQIIVTTVAPKARFDAVHATAFGVLRSWQVMPTQAN